MDLTGKLKPGMRIVGADHTDYGTVERYDDETVYVGGRPVPYSAFERMDSDRLYVGQSGARYFGESCNAYTKPHEGEIRVPLVEERLAVGKRVIELGAVEIHKTVETDQVSVPVELRHDEVKVRQEEVAERPIAAHERPDAFTGGTLRVPVRGEEAVVSKGAVVTGEVGVSREQVSERQTVSETVQQETVEVTASYDEARPGFRQHFEQFQARLRQAGGPTFQARDFADAESNYRAGFEARSDPRNANRSFKDVEPEMQRQHAAAGASNGESNGESWETHREEVRTGWEHGRG